MGAMVISQIKTFGKEVQAFEVIDGQQRLTTFQILLAALRDVAAAIESHYADELNKYLLNDGVMATPQVERYKLWPSLIDRRSFVGLIDPNVEPGTIAPKPDDEAGIVRRSTSAHKFFRERIEAYIGLEADVQHDRLEILFEALKEGLAIFSIELEGGDDPQTIFETLNSRGVDLSAADLLRNFVFQRAKGLGQTEGSLNIDELYTRHWLPLDRAFWGQSASRGRQSRQRLDWMLTDHVSMNIGDIVSVENLFETYRSWILKHKPFDGVVAELAAISTTAYVEERLFAQSKADPVGNFGRFADAFDVSTAMPLVLYLATEPSIADRLSEALSAIESYILRRDICGLPTKNYNRFFVALISRLRGTAEDRVDELITYLSTRVSDLDRWPDDAEWRQGWLGRDQYKGPRQPRLRHLFEAIEQSKRTALNEDIEIKSALTIEHIMPQKWRSAWPIAGFEHLDPDDFDLEQMAREASRDGVINKLGNLTLLTQTLNATVSNGPFSVKMPAVRAHSSLALNRELNGLDHWDETTIAVRGETLFQVARNIWAAPARDDAMLLSKPDLATLIAQQKAGLPEDGTKCKFTYGGKDHQAVVEAGTLKVQGIDASFKTFSAASNGVTKTSRNGWMDWYLLDSQGQWVLADEWRKGLGTV